MQRLYVVEVNEVVVEWVVCLRVSILCQWAERFGLQCGYECIKKGVRDEGKCVRCVDQCGGRVGELVGVSGDEFAQLRIRGEDRGGEDERRRGGE